jgi:hypothetical protein
MIPKWPRLRSIKKCNARQERTHKLTDSIKLRLEELEDRTLPSFTFAGSFPTGMRTWPKPELPYHIGAPT